MNEKLLEIWKRQGLSDQQIQQKIRMLNPKPKKERKIKMKPYQKRKNDKQEIDLRLLINSIKVELSDEIIARLDKELRKTKFSVSVGDTISCEAEAFGQTAEELSKVCLKSLKKLNNKKKKVSSYFG